MSLVQREGTQVRLKRINVKAARAMQMISVILPVKVLIDSTATTKKLSPASIRRSIFMNFRCFLLFSSVYRTPAAYLVFFISLACFSFCLARTLCISESPALSILGVTQLYACASQGMNKQYDDSNKE